MSLKKNWLPLSIYNLGFFPIAYISGRKAYEREIRIGSHRINNRKNLFLYSFTVGSVCGLVWPLWFVRG